MIKYYTVHRRNNYRYSFLITEEDSFNEHCMRGSMSLEFPEGRFHSQFAPALQRVWNQLRASPVNLTHELYFSVYFRIDRVLLCSVSAMHFTLQSSCSSESCTFGIFHMYAICIPKDISVDLKNEGGVREFSCM